MAKLPWVSSLLPIVLRLIGLAHLKFELRACGVQHTLDRQGLGRRYIHVFEVWHHLCVDGALLAHVQSNTACRTCELLHYNTFAFCPLQRMAELAHLGHSPPSSMFLRVAFRFFLYVD